MTDKALRDATIDQMHAGIRENAVDQGLIAWESAEEVMESDLPEV
jgi:hypothetical protein